MRDLLSKYRISKNLSMKKMADKIGVSKSYYEKIEYGDRKPSYNFISKFSLQFPDADIDILFFTEKTHEMCEK